MVEIKHVSFNSHSIIENDFGHASLLLSRIIFSHSRLTGSLKLRSKTIARLLRSLAPELPSWPWRYNIIGRLRRRRAKSAKCPSSSAKKWSGAIGPVSTPCNSTTTRRGSFLPVSSLVVIRLREKPFVLRNIAIDHGTSSTGNAH